MNSILGFNIVIIKSNYSQRFFDDVGVIVAMVAITLVAVIVVIIKVILVHSEVNRILIVIS